MTKFKTFMLIVIYICLLVVNQMLLPRSFPAVYAKSLITGIIVSSLATLFQVAVFYIGYLLIRSLQKKSSGNISRSHLIRRCIAYCIDVAISYIVAIVIMILSNNFLIYESALSISLICSFFVMLCRDKMTATGSIGKRIVGLRLSKDSNEHIIWRDSILRNLLPGLFYIISLITLDEDISALLAIQVSSIVILIMVLLEITVLLKKGQRPEDRVLHLVLR